MENKNIVKKIMILPKYLNDREYIINKIYEKEKKCILEGYIMKIHKINSIKFNKFYEQNFSGGILIDINFNVDIVNLEIGQTIECKIIKADEDGIVAEGLFPIYIIIDGDYERLSFIEVGDIVKVMILQEEISINRNIIKAVGKYITKTETNVIKKIEIKKTEIIDNNECETNETKEEVE